MGLPVEVNNLMLGSLGGYTVGRSLRFRSSATAYLNRTPASAGNQQKWTWSGWVKRGALSYVHPFLFSCYQDDNNRTVIGWYNSDQFAVYNIDAASVNLNLVTTAVYRDPSSWYHIVVGIDTTQATSSNRAIIYINGQQVTALSTATYPSQNTSLYMNSARQHRIASSPESSPKYFDGYIAEVNFIDGQALTPSSFGAYDTNGVWQPKKYTGTYGTNGFYLPFSNTTSTTTLVQDSSGNGNNWTPNNISLTAGTTYDSMIDSPTNAAGNSNGIGNYAVLNPLNYTVGYSTTTNGNLLANFVNSGNGASVGGTISVSSGKWYWECIITAIGSAGLYPQIGIVGTTYNFTATAGVSYVGNSSTGYVYRPDGNKVNNGTASAYGATFTTNDVIGVALDLDAGTITFYKNNVSQGTAYTGISGSFIPASSGYASSGTVSVDFNFGQRPFAYTPPSGYKALNTYNLPAPSIANGAQYMAATTYTGTGSNITITNSVNGIGFQPDFVWTKGRSAATNNILIDAVRGGANYLISDSTSAEANNAAAGIQSFNSTGYVMGTGGAVNTNGATYVGWQWKAGGTGVTNTSGTITSTVSANTTAGFSVVTYTGNGTSGATIGHGLGVAPSMIIEKRRDASANNWVVWHTSMGNVNPLPYLNLNTTSAVTNGDSSVMPGTVNSTTFTIGSWNGINASGGTYVAYCFAAVRGYSAMGSYTGNGSSDGPFIYTGFRARWILFKRSDSAQDWMIIDSSRDTYNVAGSALWPDLSNYENQSSVPANSSNVDFLSNGFKIRNPASGSGYNNASGGTYIYAAFAENPFNYSRAR